MHRRLISSLAIAVALAAVCLNGAVDTEPRLGLWYRGQPPGRANAADLTAIRAAGFTVVIWPASQASGVAEAARLAADAGLAFIERVAPVPLTPEAARHPNTTVDIVPARGSSAAISPLIWRAIAHGARDVAFDAGAASARILTGRDGQPAWLSTIGEISRQIRINGKLFVQSAPASDQPKIDAPVSAAVDIVLLSAGRAWVLVATNTSETRRRVTAHLPPAVPYAIWLNLLNGDTLAMLSEPPGPRWTFELEGWGTRIYVIDKTLK